MTGKINTSIHHKKVMYGNSANDKTKEDVQSDALNDVSFASLFDIDQIQTIQDIFSKTMDVSSYIESANGERITKISYPEELRYKNNKDKSKQSNHTDSKDNKSENELKAEASIYVDDVIIAKWVIGTIENDEINKIDNLSDNNFQKAKESLNAICTQLSHSASKNKFQLETIERLKLTEEIHKELLFRQETLIRTSKMMAGFTNTEQVFEYAADIIMELSGADYLVITSRKETDDFIKVVQLRGLSSAVQTAARLFGVELHKYELPLTDISTEEMEMFLSKKVCKYNYGLYGLMGRIVPNSVTSSIEKLLRLETIYTLGISWEGQLFGGIDFGFKGNEKFRNSELVETIAENVSNTILKIQNRERIEASENKYKMLFESLEVGFTFHRAVRNKKNEIIDYTIESCNKAYLNMFKYNEADIVGKSLREIESDNHDFWTDLFKKKLKQNETLQFDLSKLNLAAKYSINVYSPEKDYVAVIFYDLSESVKNKKALQKSEAMFKSLFTNMNEGVAIYKILQIEKTEAKAFLIDSNNSFLDMKEYFQKKDKSIHVNFQDNQFNKYAVYALNTKKSIKFSFIYSNDKCFEISVNPFGKDTVAFIFNNISERVHSEKNIRQDNEELEQKIMERTNWLQKAFEEIQSEAYARMEALEQLEASNQELQFLNEAMASESKKLVLLNEQFAESEYKLLQLNKELEIRVAERTSELLISKDKAEEANKLKDIILNNFGHEFRTPINGILGFAGLLKDNADPDTADISEMIAVSADRLYRTFNSLLVLSELELKNKDISRETIYLTDLIKEYSLSTASAIKEKGLEIIFDVKNPDAKAVVDEYLLDQAMFHIISNAVKFTEKGTITMEIDIVEHNGADMAAVSIIDTGCGIEKSKIKTIFETFRQESEGLARSYEGLGVGLTITKKIITLLDGEIVVESKTGKGSKFTLLFPQAE